jgi:glucosamine 6-phosphate synthetase-like amidotransferase/phosphosugar isomerase protein
VIAIATEGDTDIAQGPTRDLCPPITPLLSPFVTVIPLQLLAYKSRSQGCDIDKRVTGKSERSREETTG